MSSRTKPILTFLLCAAIISSFGCASTTPKEEPPRKPLYVREIGPDGEMVLRNVFVDVDVSHVDHTRQLSRGRVASIVATSLAIYVCPDIAIAYIQEALK